MKIGIGLGEIALGAAEGMQLDIPALVSQAQQAEADGFESIWLANINGMDALTLATVLGRETSRIAVGTAVVPTYPRHPFTMGQQALTTQAAIGNRLQLGIGLSHQIVIEAMLGMSWAKPYSHMKEYLSVLAPLIRKGNVQHSGDEFRVNSMVSVKGAEPCPILVAAMAPRMLKLAGGVADGTITWMTGPRTLTDHVVPLIAEGAREADRPPPRVLASLPIAVTDDLEAGRAAAAERYAIYGSLPSYRAMLDREGAAGPGDVALVGDEAAVSAQLDTLARAGVTEFIAACFPVGGDRAGSLERTRTTLRAYQHR